METLPAVGEKARVAGIDFPLIVLSYDTNTRTASLGGEHPDMGVDVLLPKVCLDHLLPADEPATGLKHAIGQYARLKSGGPVMTIVKVIPPLVGMPDYTSTMVACLHFRGNGELLQLELDVRTLNIADSRCAL